MRNFAIMIFCLFVAMPVCAQNASEQELSFVYITHDENTDTQALVARLTEQFKDTINYPDMRAAIFYLTNGSQPIVVKVNLEGDNRKDFNEILYSLQNRRSHDVSPFDDLFRIVEIFNENDIITDDGRKIYRSVDWSYYINSSFWQLKNNENVIAKLFFVMDMDQLIQSNYMSLNFYYGERSDAIRYDVRSPFGSKNICRSIEFMPLPY